MKRLTSRDGDGDAFVEEGVLKTTTYTERDTAFGKRHVPYGDIYYGNVIERLAQYEDAEGQGRLVVLPCKVGDVIFGYPFCWAEETISELGILEWKAACIHYSINKAGKTRATVRASVWKEHNGKKYAYLTKDIPFGDFGKTVFLTREAAEAALKGGAE